ncbi:hypothetical protein PJM41_0094 [Salmonella phage vB_SenS_UTK0009]|uniref:NADAR domain-containing protein n=1 Tax=Salmonella phage vB_SenS_UTK0009 TaxID=3028908 RepID=A0AAE9ZKD3_9CAUD|nr:hypothetical protein PJM41_0094 [Salmonella phage vB_SenS_UTK0009]
MRKIIAPFSGDYSFLSNFYPSPIKVISPDNKMFIAATVEHAYQAAKTIIPDQYKFVILANTPGRAKKLGREVTIRNDWDSEKDSVMLELLRQKFSIPELKQLLLATENALLIERNTWGDTYWGEYRGIGENMLGMLLMQVRSEIKNSVA